MQHRYRVFAYGRPVAQVTDFTATSIRQARYLHGDHLGSVDAITNENGEVITDGRMSFDAHGNRRAAVTDQGSAWMAKLAYPAGAAKIDGNGTTTGLRSVTSRGFTDHEMLDNVGLIHMNGRVYDPGIGRFLSVDPVFQFPENTQSLNPYSYVLNSPLTFTDPTGLSTDTGETDPIVQQTDANGNTTMTSTDGSSSMTVDANGQVTSVTMTVNVASNNGASGAMGVAGGKSVSFGSGKAPEEAEGPAKRSPMERAKEKLTEKPIEDGEINKKLPRDDGDGQGYGGFDPEGNHRKYPDLSKKPHLGIDVADAETKTGEIMVVMIRAAGDGVVTIADDEDDSDSGHRVNINHGDNVETRNYHLSKLLVEEGDKVKAGQVIGYMGRTGNVKGGSRTHLHHEVLVDGKPIDANEIYNYSMQK